MDPFSLLEEDDILDWALSPLPSDLILPAVPPPRSAFVVYARHESDLRLHPLPLHKSRNYANIHRRAIEFLRRDHSANMAATEAERSRGLRHMMRERERRGRLSQRYAELRSVLHPLKVKGDKMSIVQSACSYVRELEGVKEARRKRSKELQDAIERISEIGGGGEAIKIEKTIHASSAVESAIGMLTCLKGMDVKATSIFFYVAGKELSAVTGIQTKVKTELKGVLERELTDA